MAISPELFLAILSMDAYNRGYGAGVSDGINLIDGVDADGLGGVGSMVGGATVVRQDSSESAQAAGFYAIAYQWNGQTVISYRGTDDPETELFGKDFPIWNGDFDGLSVRSTTRSYP